MSKENKSSSGEVGLTGLLFVLFLGLKLTGYIDWSWWWVFAPIWIPVGIVLVGLVIVGALAYIEHNEKE